MRQVHAQADTQVDPHSQTCPECDAQITTDPKHGDRACTNCGLVVSGDTIDHGPEWRAFSADEHATKSRTGSPLTNRQHDRGLATNIGSPTHDAHGNTIPTAKRKQLTRLQTWNKRFQAQDSDDRNLRHALGEIERMASALGIPDTVRETACIIYRRALEDNLLPGRSIEGIATAALHIATRQAGCPRTIGELAPVSHVTNQRISRAYRYISRELNIHLEPERPEQYLDRLITATDTTTTTAATLTQTARDLLNTARTNGHLSGKSPMGLAAGAIYAAATIENIDILQTTLADASTVSTVTIRSHYHDLLALHE